MKVPLKDIYPNPFRTENYPVNEAKVEELIQSIQQTGFWDNIVARKRPDGKAEIAYGHTRLAALKKIHAKDLDHEIELIIKDLDDEHMLKVMARENGDEWGTNQGVVVETVRAVVRAYAEGKIDLDPPSEKAKKGLRFAPHYKKSSVPDAHPEHPYNAFTVAKFIDWLENKKTEPKRKVLTALDALELIEVGKIKESQVNGLGPDQLRVMVAIIHKAGKAEDAEARKAKKESDKQERIRAREAQKVAAAKAKEEQAKKKADERAAKKAERERLAHEKESASRC